MSQRHRWLKPAAFLLFLGPLAWFVWLAASDGLGANPIEFLVRGIGDWALRMLLVALAVTPLRQLTGWNDLARLRRMAGLFAFFYVCLHLLIYVGLDQEFDWTAILGEIAKRRYIMVGMAAAAMLAALAATSTDGMIRRLGGRRWRRLHWLVFPAAMLGCLHHFMMVKADIRPPETHAVILALLLGWRMVRFSRLRLKDSLASAPGR